MPEYRELTKAEAERYRHAVDVVVVTATRCETNAVHRAAQPPDGERALGKVGLGARTYVLGKMGCHLVAHVQCRMGCKDASAAILTTRAAIHEWHPRCVLMVGIAWGNPKAGLGLGDVLVANVSADGDHKKIEAFREIPRGGRENADDTLLDRFDHAYSWNPAPVARRVPEHKLGLLVSRDVLIKSARERNKVLRTYPEAIGGDMESYGVSQACKDAGCVPWIAVKAVCDWADSKKRDTYQRAAADTAVSLCIAVLEAPTALDGIDWAGRIHAGPAPDPLIGSPVSEPT